VTDALHLASTFAVLDRDYRATPVAVTPEIFEELEARFDGFRNRLLVSSWTFDADWPTWEMHPAGDEIVCLVSGDVTFVLERDGGHTSVRLHEPGAYVVVPKGTWHTARTRVATTMIFLTPGEGTRNRPVEAT